jgi:hypothetical protein
MTVFKKTFLVRSCCLDDIDMRQYKSSLLLYLSEQRQIS